MDALLAMGFLEQECELALSQCDGNVERALEILLGTANDFPIAVVRINYPNDLPIVTISSFF